MTQRIVGHVVTYDNIGLGRIDHPVSCRNPRDCSIQKALTAQKVLGFDGKGKYLAVWSRTEPGMVRLGRFNRAAPQVAMRREIDDVLDIFVDEVGISNSTLAVKSWLLDQQHTDTTVDL